MKTIIVILLNLIGYFNPKNDAIKLQMNTFFIAVDLKMSIYPSNVFIIALAFLMSVIPLLKNTIASFCICK